MLFTAVPPIMAPQTTGHPAALPQDAARSNPDTRVSAPREGGATDNARSDSHLWRDFPGRRTGEREQKSAPPTLLQIKINSMLEEQQEARAQERQKAVAPAPDAEPLAEPGDAAPQVAQPSGAEAPADQPAMRVPQTALYAEPDIASERGHEVSLSA